LIRSSSESSIVAGTFKRRSISSAVMVVIVVAPVAPLWRCDMA
jgi:hypothetical protein